MATSNYQKIKMLKLIEMLRRDADEANPLTTEDICRRLIAMEISCDRRTVTNDIELLNQYGYEVHSRMVGHKKGYYLTNRSFSDSELRLIVAAVQAADFITEKKSDELTDKLAFLGGDSRAEQIKNCLVRMNPRKHTNEQVYETVQSIETAILGGKKISFSYTDFDEKGERVYNDGNSSCTVDPIALVLHDDIYYLLAYSTKNRKKNLYRIDHIDTVEIEDTPISVKAVEMQTDCDAHVERAFKAFAGKTVRVTLEFDHSLIGCIYDKFGDDTRISASSTASKRFRATVSASIGPAFFGWIFQFMGGIEIISPKALRQDYAERIIAASHAEADWLMTDTESTFS